MPLIGSRRSSRVTDARTPSASPMTTRRRRVPPHEVRGRRATWRRGAADCAGFARARASTRTRSRKRIRSCARSTRSRRPTASGRKSTARRSARRTLTRCISSADTWMGTGGARRPTTTARAPHSLWSWRACSAARTSRPTVRSVSFSGTTKRRGSTAHGRMSRSAKRSKARKSRRDRGNIRSRNG